MYNWLKCARSAQKSIILMTEAISTTVVYLICSGCVHNGRFGRRIRSATYVRYVHDRKVND